MNLKDMAALNNVENAEECYSIATISKLLDIDYMTAYYFLTNDNSEFEPCVVIGKCKTYSRWYSRAVVENLYYSLAAWGYDVKQPEFHDKRYRPAYAQTHADATDTEQYVNEYVKGGVDKFCNIVVLYKDAFLQQATKKQRKHLLRKLRVVGI